MNTIEDIQTCWTRNANKTPLKGMELHDIITDRMRKEKKTIFHYFWASYAWQFFIYVALINVIVHGWGNGQLVFAGIAGLALYIPFTTQFIKKFTRIGFQKRAGNANDLKSNITSQHELLQQFFHFKYRFDWLGIPLSCLIIVVVIFEFWVPGGWVQHPIGALVVFMLALAAFITATVYENEKKFKLPLTKLKAILEEFTLPLE